MTDHWPFDQARNVAAVTTRQVLRERAPILTVIHYSDDHSWAFLGGAPFDSNDAMVVGMGTVADSDNSLLAVAELPPGWVARRSSVGDKWLWQQDDEA